MPPLRVIVLTDELRAHIQHGDLAGLGPIDLAQDGIWDDAELVARIVLADVAHTAEMEARGGLPPEHWEQLANQLGCIERAINERASPNWRSAQDAEAPC